MRFNMVRFTMASVMAGSLIMLVGQHADPVAIVITVNFVALLVALSFELRKE